MSELVAIDPGTNHLGLALYYDDVLESALLVERDKIARFVINNTNWWAESVIAEKPHKQQRTVNINVLVDMGLAAGEAVGCFLQTGITSKVSYVVASEWKRNLKKEVSHERIRECLKPAELARIQMPRAVKTLGHNVMDAVGLGLWKVRRMDHAGRRLK